MTKAQRDHILVLRNDLRARFLLEFFVLSTLLNGVVCSHSESREVKISSEERRVDDNPEQLYRVSVRSENDTIYNGNVVVTVGFDKMLHWVFDNEVEKGDSCSGGRTGRIFKFKRGERFAGHRKRLQFALLPIMYKMGVITTLLTGLTVLVLKGLTIGVILLIFAFGNHFTKWHKSPHHNTQPIHVHVHSQDGHKKVSSFPIHSSGPWDRGTEDANPNSYYQDLDPESYQRRLIQKSAKMVKFKRLQQ